jgi:tetratricopeptide (TPR) repeat protein
MITLEPPDAFCFSAAVGWVELGNVHEARGELAKLSDEARLHPDILEFEWTLISDEKDWQAALDLAEEILRLAPDRPFGWIHRSYCLHEMHRTDEALESLLPAAEMFPDEFLVLYNLACYSCTLGDLDAGRHWLARAVESGGLETVKKMASEDADLAPLREELEELD